MNNFIYETYLNSPEWAVKRELRLGIDKYTCQECGSRHNLEVHHRTYKNIGNEDVLNDLLTLCTHCHRDLSALSRIGNSYNKSCFPHTDYRINNKSIQPLPVESSIIFIDMRIVAPDRVLETKGDRIRLCRAHISPSDYYDNLKLYNQQYELSLEINSKSKSHMAKYEDYQWKNDRTWDVFVYQNIWSEPELAHVVCEGAFCTLNNGIICLHVKKSYPWEGYTSPTKEVASALVEPLNKCEAYYHALLNEQRQ